MPRISQAEFEELVERHLPMAGGFDFRIERFERGASRVRMPYRAGILRPGGTVAGPALMALADFTMYAVTLSIVGRVALAVTTNLNINFLRRPPPVDVIAEGSVLKAGRRLVVSEVGLYADGEDDPVAHVTGTYSIPPSGAEEVP